MMTKAKKQTTSRIDTSTKLEQASKKKAASLKLGGPAQCLATSEFLCAKTGEVSGRVWLVTGDPLLAQRYGATPLPKSLEKRCFNAQLGIITEKSFLNAYEGADLKDLRLLLDAIRSADAKKLYDIAGDYAPFYCPKCKKCFAPSLWSAMPVFDESFYDYTEATCWKGHTKKTFD